MAVQSKGVEVALIGTCHYRYRAAAVGPCPERDRITPAFVQIKTRLTVLRVPGLSINGVNGKACYIARKRLMARPFGGPLHGRSCLPGVEFGIPVSALLGKIAVLQQIGAEWPLYIGGVSAAASRKGRRAIRFRFTSRMLICASGCWKSAGTGSVSVPSGSGGGQRQARRHIPICIGEPVHEFAAEGQGDFCRRSVASGGAANRGGVLRVERSDRRAARAGRVAPTNARAKSMEKVTRRGFRRDWARPGRNFQKRINDSISLRKWRNLR